MRRFNYLNGYENGEGGWCYFIDSKRLNLGLIYDLDIFIYTASFAGDIGIFEVTLFVFYSSISIIFAILTMYHGYYLLYDTYYIIVVCLKIICTTDRDGHTTMNNPRFKGIVEECTKNYHQAKTKHKRQRKQAKSRKKLIQKKGQSSLKKCVEKCFVCFSNRINFCTHFMSNYFYFDSKYWLFGIILREFCEIMIQFYALLLYGGMNLFDTNENVLSQKGYIVEGMIQHCGVVLIFVIDSCVNMCLN